MNRRKGLFANLVFSNQIIEAGISAWGSVALRSVGTLAVLLLGVAGAQAATFPNENVGTSSAGQAISVTATRAGTVNTINVLTLGQANLDFNADSLPADSGLTTCTGETLSIGQNCKVGVIFTPTAPGTRFGAVVLLDVNNKVLGTGYASGTGVGPLATFVPGYVSTFAGNGNYLGAFFGDNGPATSAELYLPSAVAFDGAGNLYIADSAHNRVRMVCAAASSGLINGTQAKCTAPGIIFTIAGGGSGCGASETDTFGDGCNAPASTLSSPTGVAVDAAGNLYITDNGNDLVRVVNVVSGVISVFAGNLSGASGVCGGATDSIGDGCPATSATLNAPQGVTLDAVGNVYIADTSNDRIRVVSSSGIITSLVGGGSGTCGSALNPIGDGCPISDAVLLNPSPVAFDASGNMFIPDTAHNRVRKVAATAGVVSASSIISDFAGTGFGIYAGDGGPATSAGLYAPSAVAIDPAQNVYIADTQDSAIRKVSVGSLDIETIISSSTNQTYQPTKAQIFVNIGVYGPLGLAFDSQGDLFVADTLDMIVQKMQTNLSVIDLLPPPYTNAIRVNQKSQPQLITVENIGNSSLTLTSIAPQPQSQVDATTTTCSTTASLGSGNNCIVGAVFAPTTASDPLVTNIDVASPTPQSPLDIEIVGDALALNSTTTAVNSAPNPSDFGQSVTFTVTVTTGIGTLNGTVSIADTFNGVQTTLKSGIAVNASGIATFTTSSLPVGQHSIVATYANDTNGHTPSSSTDNGASPLLQVVDEVTTTTLTGSGSPSALGTSVTFTATVAVSGGGGVVPDGTVTFMDGTTVLGTPQTLPANGIVTLATTALPLGNNSITAVYSGDSTVYVLGSTSNAVIQDVESTSTSAVTSTPNPSGFGQQVTFTATVTPGAGSTVTATGTVSFLDNGTQIGTGALAGTPATATFKISSLAVGTHPITVTYAGNASFAGSTSSPAYVQTVTPTPTTTAVTAAPNPGITGVPVAITATVSSSASASLVAGTVTFTSGATTLGTATLTNGAATIKYTFATAGTYPVVVTYAGNSNLGGSASSAYPITIVNAASAVQLTVAPTTAEFGSTITFTATVTSNGVAPTGSVSFMSGTTVLGKQPLTKGAAVYTNSTLPIGTYSITAVYSGDADNATSTSAAVNLTIGLIQTSTDLVATATTSTPPQVLLVGVVVGNQGPTPTGTVTFTTNGTTIGSGTLDSSGVASLIPNLPNGTFQVVASYGGDSLHAPSQSVAVSVNGAPAQFSITLAPNTLSMTATQNATVAVNIASVGGFSDTISLGCASLPVGVTCTFVKPSVTLAASGTATSQLTIDTNSPLSGGASAMNSTKGRGFSLAGLFLPFSFIFGLVFWRLRRRSASLLTMALVAVLSLGALTATGCNGFGGSTVTPGTYTIQITGTGTQSNTIHYTTLTLTITK